jgi:cell division protein FtsB
MFDFHEKRKIRRIVYSKPMIGAIFLCTLMLSFSVYDRYVVSKEMKMKLDERYAELEELEMRAQALESKVQYLTDERGVEEELRNRFDVAKEGEQVVILVDSKRGANATATVAAPPVEEPKKRFWHIFKF